MDATPPSDLETRPETRPFTVMRTVRWGDCDPAGIIYTPRVLDYAMEILEAAGANVAWRDPVTPQDGGAHLLGTCRMGNGPDSSVVDRFHRSHDIRNLFICDGSNFVTSGRGQPTMTIMALAFRASEHIADAARSNEI